MNSALTFISSLFIQKTKEIVFIDGDQHQAGCMRTFHHLYGDKETVLVRQVAVSPSGEYNIPVVYKNKSSSFRFVFLSEYRSGKETCDKYVAAAIQKAVAEGYRKITVVSNDYDFVEIFRMIAELNENLEGAEFIIASLKPSPKIKGMDWMMVRTNTITVQKISHYENTTSN